MFSVYRKELKIYFRIQSTYIILTILLAAAGICAAVFAPVGGLQFIPVYLTPITLALAPLTQIFADRRRRRTNFENCYFSMGISPTSLTVGRFLAALTVFLIPTLELALLPPLLSALGSISYGNVYTSILGYVLLTALILALAQALLAAIPNTRIGAVCAFAPSVVFYLYHFLITLLPLGEIPLSLLTSINPIGLFYAFTYGRFPIADFLSLVAGILLCLLIGVLLCRRRRGDFTRPKHFRIAKILAVAALALTLCLSMGVALIPERLFNPSVNNSKTFEIVAETKDYIKKLSDDVTIYYLVSGGKQSADTDMQYFLYDLAELSQKLDVKIVNTAKETDFLERYGATQLNDQSFVVVSGERYFLLDNGDLYHYYNADLQISFSPTQYAYCLSAYTNYMQTQDFGQYGEQAVSYGAQLYNSKTTNAYFDGCAQLTNAIHYVTSKDVPTAKIYGSKNAMDASLRTYLVASGYYFEEIASPLEIGTDCDLLIIHTPKTDITDAEAGALSNYLAGGGKVFLITSHGYPNLPNLHSVTQEFGLDTLDVEKVVCEQDKQYLYSTELPDCFLAHVSECDITKDFDSFFVLITAHAIKISETLPEGVALTPLLYTSEEMGILRAIDANGKLVKEETEQTGAKYVCGALAQRGEGELFWLASPASASSIAYNFSQTDNFTLIRYAMNSMTDNAYATLSIPSTLMTVSNLTLNTNGIIILAIALVLVVPLALLIPAMVYLYKRKKR